MCFVMCIHIHERVFLQNSNWVYRSVCVYVTMSKWDAFAFSSICPYLCLELNKSAFCFHFEFESSRIIKD